MALGCSREGCSSRIKKGLNDGIRAALPVAHMVALKNNMDYADKPLLGMTEMGICALGDRRLHEKNRNQNTGTIHEYSIFEIIRDRANFTTLQQQVFPGSLQVELPILWQYDLYHVIEAMPEHRNRAHHDNLHSFFHRKDAERVIFDHHDYYRDRGGWLKMLWHTTNPFYGDKDFYQITGQDQTPNDAIVWKNDVNPFGPLPAAVMPLNQQQQEIGKLIDQLEQGTSPTSPVQLTFNRKLDRIVAFAKELKARQSGAMFRPFHEHTPGNYWWWACRNLAQNEADGERCYRRLWEATRKYLEDRGVNNLLYVYAPDAGESWDDIDTKAKFLAHYRKGMPAIDKIDVLSMTAYLLKLKSSSDVVNWSADDPNRHHKAKVFTTNYFRRALQLCKWLREAYPEKHVGISETGIAYESFQQIPPVPTNSYYNDLWKHYFAPVLAKVARKDQPHFCCFWRNDVHNGNLQSFYPYPSNSATFDQEAVAIADMFTTQVADLRPPVVG